jgi:hypothetical protein
MWGKSGSKPLKTKTQALDIKHLRLHFVIPAESNPRLCISLLEEILLLLDNGSKPPLSVQFCLSSWGIALSLSS